MKYLKEGDKCPKCGFGMMIIKENKDYQPFLSCDSFPDCRNKSNLTNEEFKKWLDRLDK